jgi:hypothetical protein
MHLEVACHQRLDDMTADEAADSGDEDAFHRKG